MKNVDAEKQTQRKKRKKQNSDIDSNNNSDDSEKQQQVQTISTTKINTRVRMAHDHGCTIGLTFDKKIGISAWLIRCQIGRANRDCLVANFRTIIVAQKGQRKKAVNAEGWNDSDINTGRQHQWQLFLSVDLNYILLNEWY